MQAALESSSFINFEWSFQFLYFRSEEGGGGGSTILVKEDPLQFVSAPFEGDFWML